MDPFENRLNRKARLFSVFAAALAARLAFLAAFRGGPQAQASFGDDLEYLAFARSIFHGRYEGLGGMRAQRMPGYPAFLALAHLATGSWKGGVQLAQAFLASGTCVLLALAAEARLGAGWGLACGLAAALYEDLIVPVPYLFSEALAAFLLAALMWSRERGPSPGRQGALLGLAHLTRPELGLLTAPAAWEKKGRGALVAAFAACVVPWGLRNWAVLGAPRLTTSLGGFVFYRGIEQPLYNMGLRAGAPNEDPDPIVKGELERDRWYWTQGLSRYRRLPLKTVAAALFYNFLLLCQPFIPDYDWTWMFLAPFWAWALCRRDLRSRAGLAAAAPALLAPVYSLVGGDGPRYRTVLAPCLILLAASGAHDLWRRRGRKMIPPAAVWLAANLAVRLAGEKAHLAAWAVKKAVFGGP